MSENNKDNKLTQEEVWDKIAPLWNKNKKIPFGDDEKGNLFSKVIDSKSDERILDLGCGSGRNFISIKEVGFRGALYGVDFSFEMLRYAKKNAEELGMSVILKRSKTSDLDFEDGFFDKVLCIATLHCVENEKEREETVREIYRVLRVGGRLLITTWNKNSRRWKNKPKEKYVGWNLNPENQDKNIEDNVKRYYYLYDQNELIDLLESAGFKIIQKNRDDSRNIVIIAEKS